MGKVGWLIGLRLWIKSEGRCGLCGTHLDPFAKDGSARAPTLDHIKPKSLGGTNDPRNLRVACRDCNHDRGNGLNGHYERVMARAKAVKEQRTTLKKGARIRGTFPPGEEIHTG